MKRSIRISAVMHKLLVEDEMDGFSVVEVRDASLKLEEGTQNSDEARKKVYRQIWQYQQRGWLRSEGKGRNKKYFQTEQFRELQTVPRKKAKREVLRKECSPDYSILLRESNEYKGELEIVLGEIDEYQSLRCRFPELENRLTPLLQQARERSAHLLGKINGLTNLLNTLSEGSQPC
ncbi:Transcriptional regulator VspR [Vibrio sp. B1FIG11]|uniref:hypothetical protein n=1 Tax=Vibrio sp. B1FIG11 TaxID=2751177 RepID=UPI001AF2CECD|nr:hypothetical protein [Vibrio sp. B1FIG11]CAD7797468.1 Transcriptional regulator VspR [Vibrio sp. B1FIG11]CAD7800777.1 Transcriptional regulator VspR [Vibrio sp. B1FIG11]CAD7801859.1 Transcriptional regulator VspR [Vibrio sp. B1FIG11]CAD7803206.1 Transcriptional regulator VspR [Vibrio sp. B1FIG11]CAE6879955.1 Transcriptional regulator VspR [Vibrio sp. B1FIG11]